MAVGTKTCNIILTPSLKEVHVPHLDWQCSGAPKIPTKLSTYTDSSIKGFLHPSLRARCRSAAGPLLIPNSPGFFNAPLKRLTNPTQPTRLLEKLKSPHLDGYISQNLLNNWNPLTTHTSNSLTGNTYFCNTSPILIHIFTQPLLNRNIHLHLQQETHSFNPTILLNSTKSHKNYHSAPTTQSLFQVQKSNSSLPLALHDGRLPACSRF